MFADSDDDRVVYEDDDWQIRSHCWRGYEPWHTLHKRRRLFRFTWWSGMKQWGDIEPLMLFIKRWQEWPVQPAADQKGAQ